MSNDWKILNLRYFIVFKSIYLVRSSVIENSVFFTFFYELSFFFLRYFFHLNQCCNLKTSSLPRTTGSAIQFFLACGRILLLLRRKVQTVVMLLSSVPFSKSIDRVYTRPLVVPRYYRSCLPLRIVLRFAFLPDHDQSCQHYLNSDYSKNFYNFCFAMLT